MSINPNNEIKPRLQGQLEVLVAQDLEAKGRALPSGIPRFPGCLVQTTDEAIQCAKHVAMYQADLGKENPGGSRSRRKEVNSPSATSGALPGANRANTPSHYQFIATFLHTTFYI